MASLLSSLPHLELDAVGIAWLIFFLSFFARRHSRLAEQVRDRRAVLGLMTQIAGYAILLLGLRPFGVGFLGLDPAADIPAGEDVISTLDNACRSRTLGPAGSVVGNW